MPTSVQCWGHGRLCLINVNVPVQDLRSTSICSAFGALILTTPRPAYCPLQQPRERCCFFSSLSAESDEAARWQRGFQGVSNRGGEEQAVNSFLENKVSGECFIWWIVSTRVTHFRFGQGHRGGLEESRQWEASYWYCMSAALLTPAACTINSGKEMTWTNQSVFSLMLKDTARLWSGLTKYHFSDLDIQIFNVTDLFCWHAVVHTDTAMEAPSEEIGEGGKVK